jgi:hypothetical protein
VVEFWKYSRPVGHRWLWQLGAAAAFYAEVLLFTDLRGHFGPYYSAVGFYAASVLLCVFAVLAQLDRPAAALSPPRASRLLWSGIALLAGGVAVLYVQVPVVLANPVDVSQSDIIPILQNYVGRFRSGEVVYRYITNLPYPLFPNHLPLQWLPYVPADEFGIDYRWWALGLFLLMGVGVYLIFLNTQRLPWLLFGAASLLPALMLRHMIVADSGLFAHTVEFTIIAYYFGLAAAIFSRSAVLQAAALVLCLLSRYSVVFWVPLFLWLLWRERGRAHAVAVAGLTLLGILLIYVRPFLYEDWTIFTHALSEYRIATLGEWSRKTHLFNGLGFASFFYTYAPGDLPTRIAWLQKAHVLVSVGSVVLSALTYWMLRRRIDYRALALISLMLYLATFYAFIQIPYAYLTSLVVLLSSFVLVVALSSHASLPEKPMPAA